MGTAQLTTMQVNLEARRRHPLTLLATLVDLSPGGGEVKKVCLFESLGTCRFRFDLQE